MTIPASYIVQINPRVISGDTTDLVFNGLVYSDNPIISATAGVLSFPSAATVGAYFGLDSPEYEAAVVYFNGYINKTAAPRTFFVARRINEAISAWVRGATYTGTLAQLTAVTNGILVISIDGTNYFVDNIDLSTATSYSIAAELIQDAIETQLPGVTVTYSSINKAFTITSPTAGADSVVEFPEDATQNEGTENLTFVATPDSGVAENGTLTLTAAEGVNVTGSFTPGQFTLSAASNASLTGTISFTLTDFDDGTIAVGSETIVTVTASVPVITTPTITTELGTITFTNPVHSATEITFEMNFALSQGTSLATLLRLREQDGAVISEGSDALSVPVQMRKIQDQTENWFSFTTLDEVDMGEMTALAKWANDNYGYMYVAWTTSPTAPEQTSSADPASQLKELEACNHTMIIYGPLAQQKAMFAMGVGASINWNELYGVLTYAFKYQSGLTPDVTSELDAATLENKGYNFYGRYSSRNSIWSFLYPGQLLQSEFKWVDTYVNSVWFNNQIQVSILNGLTRTKIAPYSDRGYNFIRAWCQDPVNKALFNGAINPGVTLSESQKTEVINESGEESIVESLSTDGYYIQILDPGASVRAQRESPIVNIWYTYGGAIHRVNVNSTALV